MARNGSGTYSLPEAAFVFDTVISETEVNSNFSDIATALTGSIAADGQTTISANLPMNSKKFTGLTTGSAAGDSASLGQVQAEAYVWCGTMTGTADAGVLTPSPAITAYAAGQRFVWKASASVNTGAMTVAISGLSTIAVQNDQAALVAGDHAASDIYVGVLDTTSTIQIMRFATGLQAGAIGVTVQGYDADTAKLDVDQTWTGDQTFGPVIVSYLKQAKGGDIVSASPCVIDTDGSMFDITGTTGFAAFTVAAGRYFTCQFDGALTITHGSGIELAGAANLITAAGDRVTFYAVADNSVIEVSRTLEAATSSADQVARDNTIYNAFEIARIDGLAVFEMVNTVIDIFVDETGVDTGTSTNETYDASGDYYHNPNPSPYSLITGATAIGGYYGSTPWSYLTDNDPATGGSGSTANGAMYLGTIDLGSVKTLDKLEVTDIFHSYSGTLSATFSVSDDNITWVEYGGAGNGSFSFSGSASDYSVSNSGVTGRYYRLLYASGSTSWSMSISGLNAYLATSPPNLTLLPNAITAASAPSELRVIIDHKAIDAVTMNTDATVEVSRDGGTTYTTATLVETIDQGSSRKTFAGTVDVSGQPSGTSVKWRYKTLNGKEQQLHKIGIQADVQLTV